MNSVGVRSAYDVGGKGIKIFEMDVFDLHRMDQTEIVWKGLPKHGSKPAVISMPSQSPAEN